MWIPIVKRKRKIVSELPTPGEPILITVDYFDDKTHKQVHKVQIDTLLVRNFVKEYSNRAPYYLKSGTDIQNMLAWMPLPAPYSCNETTTEYAYKNKWRLNNDM